MEDEQSVEVKEGAQEQKPSFTTPPGIAGNVEMAEQQSVAQPVEAEDGVQGTKMTTASDIAEDVETIV